MNARSLLAQIVREAAALGLTRWERLALILMVAVLLVLGKRGLAAIAGLTVRIEQQVIADENGPQVDNGIEFGDPNNPGGGETGGMG